MLIGNIDERIAPFPRSWGSFRKRSLGSRRGGQKGTREWGDILGEAYLGARGLPGVHNVADAPTRVDLLEMLEVRRGIEIVPVSVQRACMFWSHRCTE